ncbi:hypothetical protein [Lacrimispora sp.]|uniref:hypothetical protein n=1 Tax=Lacrimispora sp. TaxID=2719234 RepID=UPI003995FAF5
MPVQKFKGLSFRGSDVAKIQEVVTVSDERGKANTENDLQEIVGKLNEKKSNVPFNFKIIPRKKIIFNEKNDYTQVDIEKLAEGILHFGLIHNLEGYYDEDKDLYVIESGERRTRAIDYLLDKFKNYDNTESQEYKDFLDNVKGFEAGYPINIKKNKYADNADLSELDKIDSEIRLMDANEEVRPNNPQDKYKRVARRAELIERRNALLPYKDRVNVNKEVGAMLGMTERQVQKYKGIDSLIPELKEEFLSNNITLAEGANYSSLTEEEQRNILKLIQEGKKVSLQDIKKLKKEKEAAQTELIHKETEISKLKEESEKLQEKHKKELENIKQELDKEKEKIKRQIEEEIRSNNPDRVRVKELEGKLKEKDVAQQDIDKKLDESNKLLKQKQDQIGKLETELESLKNKPVQDLERIRLEVKLTSSLEQTVNATKELKTALTAYKKEGSGGIDYRADINKIINELNILVKE